MRTMALPGLAVQHDSPSACISSTVTRSGLNDHPEVHAIHNYHTYNVIVCTLSVHQLKLSDKIVLNKY